MAEQTEKQKKLTPVYAAPSPTARPARWTRALSLALALAVAGPGLAWSKGEAIHEAQAAFKARDQKRLAALARRHPRLDIQLWFDGQRWWVVTIFWEAETPERPIPADLLGGRP